MSERVESNRRPGRRMKEDGIMTKYKYLESKWQNFHEYSSSFVSIKLGQKEW